MIWDYMYTRSEQEREEEKGMPFIVMKDSKTKTMMAKAMPKKGVREYAVEAVKKSSSRWIQTQGSDFRHFEWQAGSGAFAVLALWCWAWRPTGPWRWTWPRGWKIRG